MPSHSNRKPAPHEAPAWTPEVEVVDIDPRVLLFRVPLPSIDPEHLKLQIKDQTLTINGSYTDFNGEPIPGEIDSDGKQWLPRYPLRQFERAFSIPATVAAEKAVASYNRPKSILTIRFPRLNTGRELTTTTLVDSMNRIIAERKGQQIEVDPPFPIDFIIPEAFTAHPEAPNHSLQMLDHSKSFVQDGVRYFPLSAAAPVAQAPASTLLHWIKNGKEFDGHPLQSYHFAPANQYFISEESIVRAANRFIKWPSQEPAGYVTLGEQRDQNGYIPLTDAARTIGVDHHTLWRWTTKKTVPTHKPLDVIKCPATAQLYIRQKDVAALKKLVPRSGLVVGRRPRPLQPG